MFNGILLRSWVFVWFYTCVCKYAHTRIFIYILCPYFKEDISICFVRLFSAVVFFSTLFSDLHQQTYISFSFWKPVLIDHIGPCKAENGKEVEGGILKSLLLLENLSQKVCLWRSLVSMKFHVKCGNEYLDSL